VRVVKLACRFGFCGLARWLTGGPVINYATRRRVGENGRCPEVRLLLERPGFYVPNVSFRLQMLAKRVIPCLDVDRGPVVKGTSFLNLRDAGEIVLTSMDRDGTKDGYDLNQTADGVPGHPGAILLTWT